MLAQDLLYAWRTLARRPAFALLVSGTLALGIGANTAMFSVVNAVLIRPLPYPEPGRLVFMYGSFAKNPRAAMSPPDYLDYRERNTTLASFAARSIGGEAVLSGTGEPERVAAARVSANFFSTLGLTPLHGRSFAPEEERGGRRVAILSWGLWQRRFGGDSSVVGRTTLVDGQATEIVGILPRTLDRSLDFQLFAPLDFTLSWMQIRRFHSLRGVGRLAPGVTLEQAQANLDAIAADLAAVYPENETWSLRVVPYRDVVVGDLGRALILLLGAVGLVLLIACGNVANVLLARATARRGEMVVRTALGASRGRIVRQLLTESLLLAVIGGIAGLGLAAAIVEVMRAAALTVVPGLADARIDGAVLAFTLVVSLLTGIVFGIAPALHAARRDLGSTLVSLGRGSRGGVRGRDVLVAGQVAISMVLLVGAGLLVQSLARLGRVDAGFDPDGVLTATLTLPGARYAAHEAQVRAWGGLADRMREIPGVGVAALATTLPLRGGSDVVFWIEGQPPASEADRRNAMVVSVSDGYFETLRIPLVAGRDFGAEERQGGPNAIVINRALAERLFPGGRALGRRLVVDFEPSYTAEVVGIVGDVRAWGLDAPLADIIYFPASQPAGFGIGYLSLALRTSGDPSLLAGPLRAAVAEVDPNLALADVYTMSALVDLSTARQRFSTQLLTLFSVAAVLLAVVGLYGVLAYAVTQRAREIGIRLALGADRREVFGMVVRRGMMVVGAGVAVGLAGAVAASRLVEGQLYEVSRTDPGVYGAVALVLALAGLAASAIPARRATRIDPVVALRAD